MISVVINPGPGEAKEVAMPDITRPDGAIIHYETFGRGHPLLLLAPGGVNSEIAFWERSRINPIKEFAGEFMVIGMDQRHAGKSWSAPPTFSYDLTAADQVAVLDALGVARAHVWGGCIGVAYVLRLIKEAPGRIGAAVGQDPVGLDHTNSPATFQAMFAPTLDLAKREGTAAVVRSVLGDPMFVVNNAGGPFARRIKEDAAFRAQIAALSATDYVALVQSFAAAIWPNSPPFFTVSEEWLSDCPAPLLIMPGSDAFHPTGIAHMICKTAPRARCLDVDCRSDAKLAASIQVVRQFLKQYATA